MEHEGASILTASAAEDEQEPVPPESGSVQDGAAAGHRNQAQLLKLALELAQESNAEPMSDAAS